MSVQDQALGIVGLLIMLWGVFTEYRVQSLSRQLTLEKNKNEDLKIREGVGKLSDSDLDSKLSKDLSGPDPTQPT